MALAQTYVIPIEGEIGPALADFLEQSLERAEREGASGVVLFVDTPGGRVDAAIRMSDTILSTPIPTLAVVQNAFSAGALITLSADQIAMLPGSEIGAALPITVLPGTQPQAADRKIISGLRGKFRAVAEARGRPAELAEAMVDPDIEIEGLAAKGEPLTLSGAKAVELGLADFEASSLRHALELAGFSSQVVRLDLPARVRVARFLTSPFIAPILLAVGVLGLVIEAFTPGFGVPGTIGAVALGLYFAGGYLAGLSGALEIILFFLGILLILAEIFLLPGFGIAGISGIGAILASLYFTFEEQSLQVGATAILIATVGFILAFRFLPKTRAGRALVLESAIAEHSTPVSERERLLGAIGTTLTDLRPAGVARFGELRVDVVRGGEFIRTDTPVRVIRVEGMRVVVRKEE